MRVSYSLNEIRSSLGNKSEPIEVGLSLHANKKTEIIITINKLNRDLFNYLPPYKN